MRALRTTALLAAVALWPLASPAFAQTGDPVLEGSDATQSAETDDIERLALARQIVDLGLPEAKREDLFFTAMDDMMIQMRAAIEPGLPQGEPEAIAILDEWLLDFMGDSKARLKSHIPALVDGMVQGYANLFSKDELQDILAFVETPSGQKFFELSSEVIGQPEFAAANQAYMEETFEAMEPAKADLTERLIEYFEEKAALEADNAS